MIKMRNNKLWVVILAVVLLAAFSAILFHHHEHGDENHGESCYTCRLAQQIVFAFSLLLTALVLVQLKAERFLIQSEKHFSRLFETSLLGRAPPLC